MLCRQQEISQGKEEPWAWLSLIPSRESDGRAYTGDWESSWAHQSQDTRMATHRRQLDSKLGSNLCWLLQPWEEDSIVTPACWWGPKPINRTTMYLCLEGCWGVWRSFGVCVWERERQTSILNIGNYAWLSIIYIKIHLPLRSLVHTQVSTQNSVCSMHYIYRRYL